MLILFNTGLTDYSALIDGRIGWTMLMGRQIVIGYASEAEISEWGMIEVPDTPPIRQKVEELRDKGIKARFQFTKASRPTASSDYP